MIAAPLAEVIQELADIEDRMERFEFIFALAEDILALPIEAWTDENRVKGCQSQAHLEVGLEDGHVHLRGGADARLVQGLMGLLALGMHGQPLEVARAMTVDHIKEAGVLNSLTPSRSNGVRTMFDMIMQELEAMNHGE
ncbi:MAG: SufE family protein [Euryarchaeota archaeon TMED141]|nr:MAG: SufE family protein [Euryarchaeota archaeon TMED141]